MVRVEPTQRPRLISLIAAFATASTVALLLPSAPARADDELVRETRVLAPFHSIRFDGTGQVDVTVGREFAVVIETTNAALPYVRTDVEGEELRIRRKRRARRAPLRIEITMPVMMALELNGSAEAQVHGRVDSPKFEVRIAGSGSAAIDELNVDDFNASLSGSGELDAAGTAGEIRLVTAGSAKLQLAQLHAHSATISISGSGHAELRVADSLDGTIKGNGQIHLTGSPNQMSVQTHGSGRIIQTPLEPSSASEEASK